MLEEKDWEDIAKNTLRAAMIQRGVSYSGLVEALSAVGVSDNEANLRNKVSRGRFTAVFLMQCLRALGVEWIHITPSFEGAPRDEGTNAKPTADPRSPSA